MAGCAIDDAPDDDETEPSETTSSELSSLSCTAGTGSGYTNGTPKAISVVHVDGKPVERDTANAYYVMAQAAARSGINLKIVSGFRTMAEQQYLYSCYTHCSCNGCALAATPGHSNHQSGHALDLNTSDSGVYAWLTAHGATYGFKRTVPSELWHWEWWGGGPGGGPCTAAAGGGPAPSASCHSDTLNKDMPENACVQSAADQAWYQCVVGEWLDRATVAAACSSEHPL